MIAINLLPPEHRPVERTPLPRLLTILIGVLLSMAVAMVWAFIQFVKLPEATNQRDEIKRKEANLRVQADEVRELETSLDALRKREETLSRLYRDRIRWTRILDRLAEARKNGDTVVLTNMEIKSASGPRGAKATRQLVLKGFVPHFGEGELAGQQLNAAYMSFVSRLIKDPKWQEIFVEGEPEYRSVKENSSLTGKKKSSANEDGGEAAAAPMPNGGWEFEVAFTFKSTEPEPKPKTAPPRAPAAQR